MKKVLFLCTQMEAGGVQVRATNMAEYFIELGIDARVAFLYTKRNVFKDKNYIKSFHDGSPSIFRSIIIMIKLFRYIYRFKPDAIVGMAHYSSPIAGILGVICRVPVRLATQTNPPISVPKLGRLLDFICGVSGVYTSNIAASKMVGDCFINYPELYRRKIKVIYNGIKVISSQKSKGELRRKFSVNEDSFILISAGRLSRQKNHNFIVKMMPKLEGMHYLILGEGELRPELEAKIVECGVGDRVRLLGELPPNDVSEFLGIGDLFLFPSKYEAFGLALVEAMGVGLPVLSSNHKALLDVVGDAGICLPIDDEEAWIGAIQELAKDVNRRRDMAMKSIERASEFSFEKMANNFRQEMRI